MRMLFTNLSCILVGLLLLVSKSNAQLPPSPIVFTNAVWVDVTNGNNTTGARGDVYAPFKTIMGALQAAQNQDTIYVLPGLYQEVITNQVEALLYLHHGVVVTNVPSKNVFYPHKPLVIRGDGTLTSDIYLFYQVHYSITYPVDVICAKILVDDGVFDGWGTNAQVTARQIVIGGVPTDHQLPSARVVFRNADIVTGQLSAFPGGLTPQETIFENCNVTNIDYIYDGNTRIIGGSWYNAADLDSYGNKGTIFLEGVKIIPPSVLPTNFVQVVGTYSKATNHYHAGTRFENKGSLYETPPPDTLKTNGFKKSLLFFAFSYDFLNGNVDTLGVEILTYQPGAGRTNHFYKTWVDASKTLGGMDTVFFPVNPGDVYYWKRSNNDGISIFSGDASPVFSD